MDTDSNSSLDTFSITSVDDSSNSNSNPSSSPTPSTPSSTEESLLIKKKEDDGEEGEEGVYQCARCHYQLFRSDAKTDPPIKGTTNLYFTKYIKEACRFESDYAFGTMIVFISCSGCMNKIGEVCSRNGDSIVYQANPSSVEKKLTLDQTNYQDTTVYTLSEKIDEDTKVRYDMFFDKLAELAKEQKLRIEQQQQRIDDDEDGDVDDEITSTSTTSTSSTSSSTTNSKYINNSGSSTGGIKSKPSSSSSNNVYKQQQQIQTVSQFTIIRDNVNAFISSDTTHRYLVLGALAIGYVTSMMSKST